MTSRHDVTVQVGAAATGWTCTVWVHHGSERTEHVVSVSRAQAERWAGGTTDEHVRDLVRRSFDFLLEREPATSILGHFDLSVIQHYFADYDEKIRR